MFVMTSHRARRIYRHHKTNTGLVQQGESFKQWLRRNWWDKYQPMSQKLFAILRDWYKRT